MERNSPLELSRPSTTFDNSSFFLDGDIVVIEKSGHRDGFYEEKMMVAQTIEIGGKRLVILEEADYLRLRGSRDTAHSDRALPPLPPRNQSGRRPAAAFILASLAREIVADRKAAGLTQQEVAKRAGIRQETLSRIETGKHTPMLKTLKRIDRAMGK